MRAASSGTLRDKCGPWNEKLKKERRQIMVAWYWILVFFVVGWITGWLVYRNNVKRFQKNEADLRKLLQEKGIPWPF